MRLRSEVSVERVERMGSASENDSVDRSRGFDGEGDGSGLDCGGGMGGVERTGAEALNGLKEYGSKGSSDGAGMPYLDDVVL